MVVLKLLGALHVLLDLVGPGVDRGEGVVRQRLGVVGVCQRRLQHVAEIFDRVKIPEARQNDRLYLASDWTKLSQLLPTASLGLLELCTVAC